MKKKLLFGLAAFAMILFYVGVFSDNYVLRLITKPIPLLVFLVLLRRDTSYRRFIFAGLLFSLLGDVLLEISSGFFIYGLLAFLTAHIMYVVAFTKRNMRLALLPAMLFLFYGIGIYWLLFPDLGEMAIPVLFYVAVILIMAWRAWAQCEQGRFALLAAIGSLFFVVSDSLIALNKFHAAIPMARWLIMLTYWTAQTMIFYSAFKAGKDKNKKSIIV